MGYKYPDSTNDPNIYADDRTISYYSSKTADLFSILFVKYLSQGSKIFLSGLPDLPGIDSYFEGILCSAVLQHLPDRMLYESFRCIWELLGVEGIFIVSFPTDYPGIDSETNRDSSGRLFYIRPEEKYRFLIERLGV